MEPEGLTRNSKYVMSKTKKVGKLRAAAKPPMNRIASIKSPAGVPELL